MLPVDEYLDRHPIPQVSGKDEEGKKNDAKKKEGKAKSLDVELDWSGSLHLGNMPRSGLEREKEARARAVSVGNFKQKEDSEMHTQFPDYEEFRNTHSISFRGNLFTQWAICQFQPATPKFGHTLAK